MDACKRGKGMTLNEMLKLFGILNTIKRKRKFVDNRVEFVDKASVITT